MYTRGHARACGISEKLINRGPCPAAAVHSYRGSTRTTLTAASARAHSHTPRHSASARCEKRLSSHPLTFSVEPSHRNNQDRSQTPHPPIRVCAPHALDVIALSCSLLSFSLFDVTGAARSLRLRRMRRLVACVACVACVAYMCHMRRLRRWRPST